MKQTVVTGPGRIYHGALEEDGKIIWECKHRHSKKEYDQRYRKSATVWETSALNCAREAMYQKEDKRVGRFGLIEQQTQPMLRADQKYINVDGTTFLGSIELNEDGRRVLTVGSPDEPLAASEVLDMKLSEGLYFQTPDPEERKRLATALWALKGSVWGVIFQDDKYTEDVPVADEAVEKYLTPSKRKKRAKKSGLSVGEEVEGTKPDKAHINIVYENDNRVFEVIDQEGEVKFKTPHRGLAFKRLDKIRGKS